MKIIFLDIDGVLNCACTHMREGDIFTYGGIINANLMNKLNELINNTDAKVVISSSWRKINTQEEIKEYLEQAGFMGTIIGMTPTSSHGFRGLEIRDWLKSRTDVENYIILDDDRDMLLLQASHFFNADCEFGLTDKIVYQATRFLNNIIEI